MVIIWIKGKLYWKTVHECFDHDQLVHWLSLAMDSRSTSTTDLKANHSGTSSPARSFLLNSVPDSFIGLIPCALASSARIYPDSSVKTKLAEGTSFIPSSSACSPANSCASNAP